MMVSMVEMGWLSEEGRCTAPHNYSLREPVLWEYELTFWGAYVCCFLDL